ncbi:MAG: 30S ribosomal protein S1 [Actinomycetota bacterium]|nr:30S ribosomal protein S1 [Actinomycetota bacterium]
MTIENQAEAAANGAQAPATTRVDEAPRSASPETPSTGNLPVPRDSAPTEPAATQESADGDPAYDGEATPAAEPASTDDDANAATDDTPTVAPTDDAPTVAPTGDTGDNGGPAVDQPAAPAGDDPTAADSGRDPSEEPDASAGADASSDTTIAETPSATAAPEASSDTAAPTEAATRAEPHRGMRPAITAPRDIGHVEDDLSADDFAEAVDRTVFEFREGDIVAGRVVRVDPDEVLIDIGYKSEGVVPANELSIRNTANPADVVSVGDEIEALVLQKEDENGRLVLSKKRAQYERAWGRIEQVMIDGGTVTGPVIEVVKGGLIVDIGLRGFLPASLVDLRRVRDLFPFVGETIEAKVIELDKNRNNVVLSRRAYLEEAQAEQRQAFLGDLQPGDIRDGVVSSVVNFGAFVDLGGMDGLVHVSELSWQHVSHPSEIVNVGDKVQVKVLEVDRDRERISLSIRQTREDPWDMFARDVVSGAIVDGEVTKTVPFGAFVSVSDGVEGLVHVSEIAIHHVPSPELELSIGQPVRVKVTEIDMDRRRVSLSIKQALPEWEERSQWTERPPQQQQQQQQQPSSRPPRPSRREFQREEEEAPAAPSFNADASLEAILQELKERGIGRK